MSTKKDSVPIFMDEEWAIWMTPDFSYKVMCMSCFIILKKEHANIASPKCPMCGKEMEEEVEAIMRLGRSSL